MVGSSSTIGRYFTDTLLIVYRDIGEFVMDFLVLNIIFPNTISLFLSSPEIPYKLILFQTLFQIKDSVFRTYGHAFQNI